MATKKTRQALVGSMAGGTSVMKMNRNMVGVLAAVLLAVVGGFLVWNSTQGSESDADDDIAVETTTVLVARQDIAAQTVVADVAGDEAALWVDTQQVPVDQVVSRAITSIDGLRALGVEGYVFSALVTAGNQLSESQLTLPGAQQNSALVVDADLFEVTVALAPERALGGRIFPGDRVALIGSFEAGDSDSPDAGRQTVVILENVLVTNVQTEAVVTPEQQQTNVLGTSLVTNGRLFITFGVTVDELERLTYGAEYASLWLANQNAEAVTNESKIRDRDNVIGLAEAEETGPTVGNGSDLTLELDDGAEAGN